MPPFSESGYFPKTDGNELTPVQDENPSNAFPRKIVIDEATAKNKIIAKRTDGFSLKFVKFVKFIRFIRFITVEQYLVIYGYKYIPV